MSSKIIEIMHLICKRFRNNYSSGDGKCIPTYGLKYTLQWISYHCKIKLSNILSWRMYQEKHYFWALHVSLKPWQTNLCLALVKSFSTSSKDTFRIALCWHQSVQTPEGINWYHLILTWPLGRPTSWHMTTLCGVCMYGFSRLQTS